jgi:hypothetical protein
MFFFRFAALPGIVISGTLPQLSVHVNEDKVSMFSLMPSQRLIGAGHFLKV